jgi:hypothetical protein
MFNRTYPIRSAREVRKAGGGHRIADRTLATIHDGAFYRPKRRIQPGAAPAPKKNSQQMQIPFPMTCEQLDREFDFLFSEKPCPR